MFATETKILIVDDMVSIRELVRASLLTLGFRNVQEAENGEDAYNLLVKNHGTPQATQLIISDWNMPKVSGLDLLKKVRSLKEFQNLPFVLLTSEADRDQVTEAVLAGVSQYMVKPFSTKILEEKLKGAFSKHHGKS